MKPTKTFIPDESIFRDREKEARFWEEHFDEAWASGKPIKVTFAKNLSRQNVNIKLDTTTFDNVKKQAKAQKVNPTKLMQMWIMEKAGTSPVSSIGM